MRKLFLHTMVSLDGFIEDQDRQMDWHFADDEWEAYVNEVLASIDGMVFGRVAHEMLAHYWPTAAAEPGATAAQIETARWMQSLPKYVVSSGGYRSDWDNSIVFDRDVEARIRALKGQPGKDIALFAGARAFQSLDALGLVDEYRVVLNPVLLGGGTPLFKGRRSELRLAGIRRFQSGAAVLTYAPDPE